MSTEFDISLLSHLKFTYKISYDEKVFLFNFQVSENSNCTTEQIDVVCCVWAFHYIKYVVGFFKKYNHFCP